MTFTKTIPAESLAELDLRQGDTLHVVAIEPSDIVVRLERFEPASRPDSGKAREWIQTSKGSVHLAATESLEDVRDEFYAAKYGPKG